MIVEGQQLTSKRVTANIKTGHMTKLLTTARKITRKIRPPTALFFIGLALGTLAFVYLQEYGTLLFLGRFPHATPLIDRAFILNVQHEEERYMHALKVLRDLDAWRPGLVQRFDAATEDSHGCEPPYSIDDCCTTTHLNVLRHYAKTQRRNESWALIFEDDVVSDPSISSEKLPDLITDVIKLAEKQSVTFVYLGVCLKRGEECADEVFDMVGIEIGRCSSATTRRCTHAYAVRRDLASYLPDLLIRANLGTIDASLEYIFAENWIPHLIAGVNLHSPDECSHIGLFHQTSSFWGNSLSKKYTIGQPCDNSSSAGL